MSENSLNPGEAPHSDLGKNQRGAENKGKRTAKRAVEGRVRKRRAKVPRTRGNSFGVREVSPGVFELVYPPRHRQYREDIEEVYDIIAHEEWDLAVDELLWLLQQCRDLLEAHQLLGRIALYRGKLDLARGHLGYAYELGLKALAKDFAGQLPFSRSTNRPFLQAGRDLVECLVRLNERSLAETVAEQLLKWSPDDPLGVRRALEEFQERPRDNQWGGALENERLSLPAAETQDTPDDTRSAPQNHKSFLPEDLPSRGEQQW